MRYHRYGKNGPEISALGFGVMRLPVRQTDAQIDDEAALAVMRAALDAGVNFFDSHHQYHGGFSEAAIGRLLRESKGARIVIQTKTPFYQEQPLDYFKKLLDEALVKTGVKTLDYLLFHSMNMEMFKNRGREFIRFTDWAINRGMIRCRGFSAHDTPENVKAFVDTGEFSVMLLSYNWLNPAMAEVIAYGAEKGLGVSIMNPVGGGSLNANTPEILQLIPGAVTAAEVALRFVMATPGVTATLSGMNTVEQVIENTRIASREPVMTAAEFEAMRQRLDKLHLQTRRYCTACGYCMPCPQGVDIPENFRLLNRARFFGMIDHARRGFKGLKQHKDGDKSATACNRCGQCLPKCPIKVPIIDQLAEAAKRLDE